MLLSAQWRSTQRNHNKINTIELNTNEDNMAIPYDN